MPPHHVATGLFLRCPVRATSHVPLCRWSLEEAPRFRMQNSITNQPPPTVRPTSKPAFKTTESSPTFFPSIKLFLQICASTGQLPRVLTVLCCM